MALSTGNPQATSGLARALYEAMDAALRPPLQQQLHDLKVPDGDIPGVITKAQAQWQQLSYTLAAGLVPALSTPAAPPAAPAVFAETFSSADYHPEFWGWLTQFVAAVGAAVPAVKALKTPDHLKGVLR